jgi:hypothetical protein
VPVDPGLGGLGQFPLLTAVHGLHWAAERLARTRLDLDGLIAFVEVKARTATTSMSRWPERYRRERIRQPVRSSQRTAIRSPSSPKASVVLVTRAR